MILYLSREGDARAAIAGRMVGVVSLCAARDSYVQTKVEERGGEGSSERRCPRNQTSPPKTCHLLFWL